eukprot:GHVN01039217.1.p2 GENE.GHVN01039217.1~~GHVN01039217.1.p2  ORF type:complete len:167 (-),score=7.43 GHVN01039217.1:472-972(-)
MKKYMGLQIIRTHKDLFIFQRDYIIKIVKDFEKLKKDLFCYSTPTCREMFILVAGPTEFGHVCQHFIGALLYVMRGSRCEIAFSVGALSRATHRWLPNHVKGLINVFGFLKGTTNYGLKFATPPQPHTGQINLYSWSDAHFARDQLTHRSTSDGSLQSSHTSGYNL